VGTAYTPGLRVSRNTSIVKERRLPLKGDVLVKVGDEVEPSTPVARAELPGDLHAVKMVERLGGSYTGQEIFPLLLVKEGDKIEKDQPIARTKGLFGKWFKTEVKSPIAGTMEYYMKQTGSLGVRTAPHPVEVNAYIRGKVLEIFEGDGCSVQSEGAFIQGIFGVGGERQGIIKVVVDSPKVVLTKDRLPSDIKNLILVGGSRIEADVLRAAHEGGAKGVIAGGIINEDLIKYLGYEIGVAITGQEQIPITMIVTEGFGTMEMAGRTFELFKALDSREASLNGATQIRAGAQRPEIFVHGGIGEGTVGKDEESASILEAGTRIRIIRVPYFGKLARVTALPHELQRVESGSLVRMLEAELDGGEKALVPRANVEIIAE
jgi:hypothetical protein